MTVIREDQRRLRDVMMGDRQPRKGEYAFTGYVPGKVVRFECGKPVVLSDAEMEELRRIRKGDSPSVRAGGA